VEVLKNVRNEQQTETSKIIICGVVGSRGDGYAPTEVMTIE
jgi:hypothetical protein